jgi:hypothetical protein
VRLQSTDTERRNQQILLKVKKMFQKIEKYNLLQMGEIYKILDCTSNFRLLGFNHSQGYEVIL